MWNDVTWRAIYGCFLAELPHSIQGLGPDGAKFLLVFNDGNFNEFETFLLTDWFHHTPREVLAKNFLRVPESIVRQGSRERAFSYFSN